MAKVKAEKASGTRSIDELAADPRNPRRISAEAAAGLGESLARFGDAAGIVFNSRTQQLVCGHQRLSVLRAAGADSWAQVSETSGYIEHPTTRERFAVRIVDWNPEQQRQANLALNNAAIAGSFTEDAMRQLEEIAAQGVDLGPLRLDALMEELREAFPQEPAAPEEFPEKDENIATEWHCPKCGYEWSGKQK